VRGVIQTSAFLKDRRTALVVIDLQRGILARDVGPHTSSEVLANTVKIARAFRAASQPVVWVHVSYASHGGDMLKPLVDEAPPATSFSAGWDELVPELGIEQPDIVVTKRNWGAFYGTDLDLQLRRRDVTAIALCGIATNIGVESTARDAFERNYKLLFVEDAMASMSAQEHEHSCARIFPRMGIVRSTSDVIDALRGSV